MSACDRVAYGFGVFFIICGIIIGFIWPLVFSYLSKEKLALNPSSETYKLWVKTPIPMYLDIYLFNWTNAAEFLRDKKVKPVFEEIGPFVFKEVHERVDVTWNEKKSVSYNQTRTWSFVPDLSTDLSVPIVNLNVIATTITKKATRFGPIVRYLLEFLNNVYKEKLLITKPANEWLFDGINDKLLNFIRKYISIPYDKFGWFYGRNLSSSYDGRFTISTGEDNIFNLGEMEDWNNVNQTRFYPGQCGGIRGSSGDLFSPLKNLNDLNIFVTDFCGPLALKFAGQKSIQGLNGYYYVGDESVFDNGTLNPSGECFCTGECIPSGVRNVTSCREAPLFISFPHFYLADPTYTEAITGMRPNKTLHEFHLSIDPYSGIPLEVRAQLQINVLLEPLKLFPMFVDVPKIYVPMLWFRQRVEVTPELASRGRTLQMFGSMGLWLGCGISLCGLLIIVVRICFVKFSSRNKKFELLITPNDSEESQTCDSETER